MEKHEAVPLTAFLHIGPAAARADHAGGVPVRSMFVIAQTGLGITEPRMNARNQLRAAVNTEVHRLAGMLKTVCVRQGNASYLALTLDEAARGTGPSEIPRDFVAGGKLLTDWGKPPDRYLAGGVQPDGACAEAGGCVRSGAGGRSQRSSLLWVESGRP